MIKNSELKKIRKKSDENLLIEKGQMDAAELQSKILTHTKNELTDFIRRAGKKQNKLTDLVNA